MNLPRIRNNPFDQKGHPTMSRLFRDVNYCITSANGETFKALLQSQNKVMLHFTLTKDGMEPRQLFGARNGDHLVDSDGRAWQIAKVTKAKEADSKYDQTDREYLKKMIEKNSGNKASVSFKIGEDQWVAILRRSRRGLPRIPKTPKLPKVPKASKRIKKVAIAPV